MEKLQWSDDMAYAFSAHRFVLWAFGSWPLQNNSFYSHIRWALITVIELSLMVPAIIEVFVPHDTHEATLDNLLFLECGILSLAKNIFPRIHVKKLVTNIECAMMDWLTELRDESSYRIMKKYARIGRLVTLAMFNTAYWCYCLSYLSIVFYPSAQLNLPTNGSTIRRNFLISASWLTEDMSDSVYLSVFVLQISQTFVVGMRLTVVDSFFFTIVMHMCGQLQVLSMKLRNLRMDHKTNSDHKKQLVSLVGRHCQLIELVKNIEDAFSVIILLQILLSVILIALDGTYKIANVIV
ncbi:hypothetical protein KM043_007142 [Ampulex compressa]|nr:hypothetical protein KM043_007142 [Ampulex compressa]